jgi:hypothetical protein
MGCDGEEAAHTEGEAKIESPMRKGVRKIVPVSMSRYIGSRIKAIITQTSLLS